MNDPRGIVVQGTDLIPDEHLMGVPVVEKDQLTGLLVVWRTGTEREYNASELDFLANLAHQAATAIKNVTALR